MLSDQFKKATNILEMVNKNEISGANVQMMLEYASFLLGASNLEELAYDELPELGEQERKTVIDLIYANYLHKMQVMNNHLKSDIKLELPPLPIKNNKNAPAFFIGLNKYYKRWKK